MNYLCRNCMSKFGFEPPASGTLEFTKKILIYLEFYVMRCFRMSIIIPYCILRCQFLRLNGAIPGAIKVTFSMRYNACVLEVKLKHTVHSYYGWIVSEVSRGDFHPQSHPCPLQKHPNEWNWCLVTDIYKRVANNNLLLLAYMRIFFSPQNQGSLSKRQSVL